MLEVSRLEVAYGPRPILHGLDLVVDDHEVVSVLGPSGSGKSTLLRAIAGLEPPLAGAVRWDGVDLREVPVHRRGFGLMFQEGALFLHRRVLGNVRYGLRARKVPRAEANARARAALERVGLAGFEDRAPATLSGGERQRVALARALAPEPRLLLLDEPFGSLDRHLRDRLAADFGALVRQLGIPTVLVTHDLDEAFSVADRVIVLHEGRVEQVGSPAVVWNQPATEWVARFLGFSNVARATVRHGQADSPWGLVPAPGVADGPAVVAARADGVHIRPQDVPASRTGPGLDAGAVRARSLTARVATVAYRRDHFLVRLEGARGLVEAVAPTTSPPAPGSAVSVRVDLSAVAVIPGAPAGADATGES